MWIEKRKDHYRMYERYVDPITKKKHKVSVKFDKDCYPQAETFTNPENNGFSGFSLFPISLIFAILGNFAPQGQIFGN